MSTRRRAAMALLLLVPVPTIGVVLGMWLMQGPVGQIAFGLSKVWVVLLPVAWRLFVDRKPISWSPLKAGRRSASSERLGEPSHLGSERRGAASCQWGGIALGALTGLFIAGLIFAAYFSFAHHWIDAEKVRAAAEANGLANPIVFIVGCIYWVTINSLLEEYVWRWFVFEKSEQAMPAIGPYGAAVVSAFLFTLHHIAAVAAQGFVWQIIVLANLGVFLGGVIWSWLYARYRSIWPGYVSHAIIDIPIFVIGWLIIFGS